MKYLNALKIVPFFCLIIGISINNMKNEISSQGRLILSLLLLLVSLISFIIVKVKSPKNEKIKRQTSMLLIFIFISGLVFFYFLYFKK